MIDFNFTRLALFYSPNFGEGIDKINFYLVIVTAAIGGLILASNIPEIKVFLLPIASVLLLVLFIMGWVIYLQGLDLNANSIFMYRRMGRIRQWFLEEEPNLYPYLPFNSGDDKPRFYEKHARLRAVDSILVVINAILAAMFFVLLWFFACFQVFLILFTNPLSPYLIALGIGTVIFIVVWTIEFRFSEKFMKMREDMEAKGGFIHFPTGKIHERFGKTKPD